MRQKSKTTSGTSENRVREIRRATRKHPAAEEKIRIVLDGLRGETSIAELCRREGIAESMYYSWSTKFLEAGKRRLAGDRTCGDDRRSQAAQARGAGLAEQALELRLLKKHDRGWGRPNMRLPASEKLEIFYLVEQSHPPARRTLEMIGVKSSRFYRWYGRSGGSEALEDRPSKPDRVWNHIPDAVRQRVVAMALEQSELSPRELATRFTDTASYYVSESWVYRLLKAHDLIASPAFIVIEAADEFKDKTTAPNQLWQTDLTYLKVIGWGWYYLSIILDDYSHFIIAWKLCTTMRADDVTETLELALMASGCDSAKVVHKPRLLSDNGSSYISGDLAEWLQGRGMAHARGAPCHPQTQGKIKRWHQTLKNRILLETYYLPSDLEAQIARFVEHYNYKRYHESLKNLTPADVCQTILIERERIKRDTIKQRRLQHHLKAA